MTGLFLYVRLFVGSALPNADDQMFSATVLVVGFGGATLLCAFLARAMLEPGIRWSSEAIEYTGADGNGVRHGISDVVSTEHRPWHFADCRLRFANGETLDVISIAGGTYALLADIASCITERNDILAAAMDITAELATDNAEIVLLTLDQRAGRANIWYYTLGDATAADLQAAEDIAQRLIESQLVKACEARYVGTPHDDSPDGYVLYPWQLEALH